MQFIKIFSVYMYNHFFNYSKFDKILKCTVITYSLWNQLVMFD